MILVSRLKLGTDGNAPVGIKVQGKPALRIIPNDESPSILQGHVANRMGKSAIGAVIAGGGSQKIHMKWARPTVALVAVKAT